MPQQISGGNAVKPKQERSDYIVKHNHRPFKSSPPNYPVRKVENGKYEQFRPFNM